MANALPWSVRGIDPDIREQAVEAAQRSGLSVGQWLNSVLAENLDDQPTPAPARGRKAAPRRNTRLDEIADRLDRLDRLGRQSPEEPIMRDESRMAGLLDQVVEAIERLETHGAAAPARRSPPEKQVRHTPDAFKQLEQRVHALTAQDDEARNSEGIEARLSGLLDQIERVNTPPRSSREAPRAVAPRMQAGRDDDPAFSAALAEIEARRRELDQGPAIAPRGAARLSGTRMNADPAAFDLMRQQLDQLLVRIDGMRSESKVDSGGVEERLSELAGRIEAMRVEPKPDQGSLNARLAEISARIDEWRRSPNEDVMLIRRDLASLAAAIESLAPQHLVGMVETAIRRVAASVEGPQAAAMPDQVLGSLQDLQNDVQAVMREVVSARGFEKLAQQVGLVAGRLDEIGHSNPDPLRIDEIFKETDAIKTLIGQAVRSQPLDGLSNHLALLNERIEAFGKPGVAGDPVELVEAIRDVRERIERIDPQEAFAAMGKRLDAITQIEVRLGALAGIEEKLEAIARDVSALAKKNQPFPQLDSIAERLERIDRVLDGPRDQPFSGLDQMAEKLDRIGLSLDKASSPADPQQHAALVRMLEALSARIEEAQNAPVDTSAYDALQHEISQLGRKLELAGPADAEAGAMGKTITALLAQMDETRQEMRELANEAAQKAAREAVRTVTRDEGGDALAAEGLLLIKRDLGDFKMAQSDSEKRTRQALEAVHGTLEGLVTRLSQMEPSRAPALREPAQAAAVSPSPANPALARAQEQRSAPQVSRSVEARALTPAALGDAPSLDDLPLEPGQQPGQAQSADLPLSNDPRANFIAAARRAAQAASEGPSGGNSAAEDEKKPGRFASLLGRGKPKAAKEKPEAKKPEPVRGASSPVVAGAPLAGTPRADVIAKMTGGAQAAPSLVTRMRRPLLLGVTAVLLAGVAMKVLNSRQIKPSADLAPAGEVQMERAEPSFGQPDRRSSLPSTQLPRVPGDVALLPPGTTPNSEAQKRDQRLSEASAAAQADPLTVGSISGDGVTKPLDTGREALKELAGQTALKGHERMRDAALAGNPAAMFDIGGRLADGRGLPRDAKLGARWFEQAAAMGHAPSQYRLASLYREGRGIAKDLGTAFQWFDRAAAQGHVLAMHNAAVLLAEGVHGTPDYPGAALWFKRAAEHGVKDSQFNVAILFARGLGVNQDLSEAYRWFSLAAAQGDADAGKKRDDIAARLTREQLAKEKERLKQFAAQRPNPAVNESMAPPALANVPPIGNPPRSVKAN